MSLARTPAPLALLLALLLPALLPPELAAQALPILDAPPPPPPGVRDGALALGAVGLLFFLDEPVTRIVASDHPPAVGAGAVMARFVNGRGTVPGVRAANFLVTAGGAGAGWSFER